MLPDLRAVPLVHLSHDRVTLAYANWGAWVADCPSPHCDSALMLEPGQQQYRCYECPATADVAWPEDYATIQYLLQLRPAAKTRNWRPPETAADLMFENAAHGIDMSATGLDGSATGQIVFDPETLGVMLLPEAVAIDAMNLPEIGS